MPKPPLYEFLVTYEKAIPYGWTWVEERERFATRPEAEDRYALVCRVKASSATQNSIKIRNVQILTRPLGEWELIRGEA